MLGASAIGCSDGDGLVDGIFTTAELAKIDTLGPLPALPADPTNRFADDARAATLGQRLFFERGYSGPLVTGNDGLNGGLGAVGERGKVACRSCHLQQWMIDTRSQPNGTSLGIDWFFRNAPSLVNVAYYKEQFGWSGFNDVLWGKNLIPAEFIMGMDRTVVAHFLYQKYRTDYDALFTTPLPVELDPAHPDAARFPASASPNDPSGPWKDMAPDDCDSINLIFANYGKAIEAYERRLISLGSPFDRYLGGDTGALSLAAKRGLKLFVGKAACDSCHSGPTLSDEKYHNTAVSETGVHNLKGPDFDLGRFTGIGVYLSSDFNSHGRYNDSPSIDRTIGVVATDNLKGAFRTKTLRSVAMTAPYMHTGELATLKDVVRFYNQGGGTSDYAGTRDALIQPLNLTESEMDDLVAFLESLTGDPVPSELLVDTSAP
ncbi:MAG TPA: cytochrome c peroxidase [Kofleriaceae bacterium]|nr:cytochrome c peroxidase [Kofleriaceae bacterium]